MAHLNSRYSPRGHQGRCLREMPLGVLRTTSSFRRKSESRWGALLLPKRIVDSKPLLVPPWTSRARVTQSTPWTSSIKGSQRFQLNVADRVEPPSRAETLARTHWRAGILRLKMLRLETYALRAPTTRIRYRGKRAAVRLSGAESSDAVWFARFQVQ